jgi:hypothetical protein
MTENSDDAVDKMIAELRTPLAPSRSSPSLLKPLRTSLAEKPAEETSLPEQLARLEQASANFREAVHRKAVEIRNGHEQRLVELRIAHERAVAEAGRETRDKLAVLEHMLTGKV